MSNRISNHGDDPSSADSSQSIAASPATGGGLIGAAGRTVVASIAAVALAAAGCGDMSGGGPGGPSGGQQTLEKEVDKQCVDGKYSGEIPDPTTDISSLKENYTPANLHSYVKKALDKRYPVGAWLVRKGLEKKDKTDCVEQFAEQRSSAQGVNQDMSTIVHECGHMHDVGHLEGTSTGNTALYALTDEVSMTCKNGASKQLGGKMFPRGELMEDDYASKRPPCDGTYDDCDAWAPKYLNGDTEDEQFHSGDQGFDMLMEEAVQYTHALYTDYAFKDAVPENASTSGIDGLLTWLWYIERYLRLARTEHPEAYQTIKESSCWRRLILKTWGSAWDILAVAGTVDKLGIEQDRLFELVRDPELLKEIDRIRQAHGCN